LFIVAQLLYTAVKNILTYELHDFQEDLICHLHASIERTDK